ncbi:MAG: mycofactocin-coupled SDR family oxidoreductase [Syntrophobacteraceae bacterium]|nr:mycofactocin-coupled SDR family oxidoreductase [Syntrophobacteraceae bacterium]
MKLEGKVAIITGGARGNGLAAARCLAREGADIAIADICRDIETTPYQLSNPETMAGAVRELEQMGRKAIGIECDVRNSGDVEAMVKQVMDTFGKVDILVNNAGIGGLEALVDMSEEAWDDMLDIHLKGTFLCCKHVVPHMIEQHGGKVVNISSVGGLRGFGMGSHYCAAKHGIIGLTKSLAMETADHNINVNVVCPGTVWTDMMAGLAGAFGMETEEAKQNFFAGHLFKDREICPEDVGQAVRWLCTEDSKCMTGGQVVVDAGWTARAP